MSYHWALVLDQVLLQSIFHGSHNLYEINVTTPFTNEKIEAT